MKLSLEAIIAIISLVVGLPPALFMLSRCWLGKRRSQVEQHQPTTSNNLTSFETLPRDELILWSRPTFPIRVWSFAGYQMDLVQNHPVIFPLQQATVSRGHDFGHLRGGSP
ncbi:uncharacterized protein LY79DRAFT_48978 [Colletotrichum navitas]|uniref:Uncharacterized protein n=1 Tax=Colletotrichum navitas TaxID=681940 RepID=A0AAD8Q619_9PEZI|nr:uncharacterized protein LY79DRAFT_48978 [Colletotrichum navitas]KAK1596595.1 hypothetical protein LY79DRAFT_48978 [Colletotrichum navitas]